MKPACEVRLRAARARSFFLFLCALIFAPLQIAMAASCPYCGRTYGEPAPGDEARVYALRAEHEANCPSRPRNGGTRQRGSDAATYGAVTIFNQTRGAVTYQIQFRSGARWQQATVQPGGYYYHWQSLPAQFQIRIPAASGTITHSLGYNTVTGREPTWEDGRPFYITGSGKGLSFREGKGSGAKPKLSTAKCRCGGKDCVCIFDSCGKNGAAKCGCGGKADCDCRGLRCPKFANTTECTGAFISNTDGKWHCNRQTLPGGRSTGLAGAWSGSVKVGHIGTFNLTFRVSPDESSVYESGGLKNGSHRARRSNGSLVWRSGILSEIEWTLTPDADGRSATLRVRTPLGVSDNASVRRLPNQ